MTDYDDAEYEPYYDESTDGDPTPSDEAAHERAEYIAGLHRIADVLQEDPTLPLPTDGTSRWSPLSWVVTSNGDQKATVAAIRRALGGTWDKKFGGSDEELFIPNSAIRGVHVQIISDRDVVCTRKVVGRKTVEKQVPVSFKTETVTEDIFEYDCGSLLAGAS